MTCVIFGKIKNTALNYVDVFDLVTKEEHKVFIKGSKILELKEGDTWIFQGTYKDGKITAEFLDVRKFLNPLYEEDLFAKSGAYILVTPINDPFPEAFKELLAENEPDNTETEVPQGTTDSQG